MLFFMILRFSDFQILLSILFHSIPVEEENEFLKKPYLTLKKGTFVMDPVKYDLLDTGIILRRYVGDCLLRIS